MEKTIKFCGFRNGDIINVKMEPTCRLPCYFRFKDHKHEKFRRHLITNNKSISRNVKNGILNSADKLWNKWRPNGNEIKFFGLASCWVPSGRSSKSGEYEENSYGILYIDDVELKFIFWFNGRKYKYVENVNFDANKIVFQGSVDKK